MNEPGIKRNKVKCVVWDLDNTIWDGVLLEDEKVTLRQGVVHIMEVLDNRGILQSIASKNEHNTAMIKLKELGIEEYFIYPQINWNSKSSSINAIAKSINIGIDTLAFIDDQPFELEEIRFSLPDVLCIDSRDLNGLLDVPEMNPRFVTEDSKMRRKMYLNDIQRNTAEENFKGSQEEFLASLNMSFSIAPVSEGDLQRAEELTVRTHQLNTTGYTYSYEELDNFRKSESHKLYLASLEDKFGVYGKIGLVLIECKEGIWTIKLLLMSCRVMSRGVGTILINHIMRLAKEAGVKLRAEFIPNDRNRMMYITYKFGGFSEAEEKGGIITFENNLDKIQPMPDYVKLNLIS